MKAGVLFQTEWIKARSRLAARIPVLVFTGFMLLLFGGPFYQALQKGSKLPAFPGEWSTILTDMPPLGSFFVAVVLMLLISSEFTWRTARQNIIDGLSREEWFRAKLILLPIVVILFLALQVTIGGSFALIGTWLSTTTEPLMSAIDLASLGGLALAIFGMGSLAFMLAFLTRNSGSAISLFFLYVTIGEGILVMLIRQRIQALAPATRYFPASVFMKLQDRLTYDPVFLERMTTAALEAGRTPPQIPPSLSLMVPLAFIYSLTFIAIAYNVYRRRDL
jgi:ABC-type transport system involved in multi-copper enzyme maturation permease subunit